MTEVQKRKFHNPIKNFIQNNKAKKENWMKEYREFMDTSKPKEKWSLTWFQEPNKLKGFRIDGPNGPIISYSENDNTLFKGIVEHNGKYAYVKCMIFYEKGCDEKLNEYIRGHYVDKSGIRHRINMFNDIGWKEAIHCYISDSMEKASVQMGKDDYINRKKLYDEIKDIVFPHPDFEVDWFRQIDYDYEKMAEVITLIEMDNFERAKDVFNSIDKNYVSSKDGIIKYAKKGPEFYKAMGSQLQLDKENYDEIVKNIEEERIKLKRYEEDKKQPNNEPYVYF